jgi:hypothetical protein
MIILPRQARDKHKGKLKKSPFCRRSGGTWRRLGTLSSAIQSMASLKLTNGCGRITAWIGEENGIFF